jgi:hypothetical protein
MGKESAFLISELKKVRGEVLPQKLPASVGNMVSDGRETAV